MYQRKFDDTGRWAFVDLTLGKGKLYDSDSRTEKPYCGGQGIGVYHLAEKLKTCHEQVDPLGPKNRIVKGGTPIHGIRVDPARRNSACFLNATTRSRQPLLKSLPAIKGLMTSSSVGGSLPVHLKKTGVDQIIIKTCLPRPVCLAFDGNVGRIAHAGHVCFEGRDGT